MLLLLLSTVVVNCFGTVIQRSSRSSGCSFEVGMGMVGVLRVVVVADWVSDVESDDDDNDDYADNWASVKVGYSCVLLRWSIVISPQKRRVCLGCLAFRSSCRGVYVCVREYWRYLSCVRTICRNVCG